MARELGRSHRAVLEELKKPLPPDVDCWTKARLSDEQAHEKRVHASKRMRLKSKTIRHYVELHLREARWTPEVIAGKLKTLGYLISYEAIYQWIHIERPDLKECLPVAGRSRKRRRTGKASTRKPKQPAAPKKSIELLPLESKERRQIGHLELDAIVGKRGGTVIQNKVDRFSRKIWLDKSPSLSAQTYSTVLIERLKTAIPAGILKSILQDNGVEHACHPKVDEALGCSSYFCHPYCASERGTIENRNRSIRRYLPKGSPFDDLPDEYLEFIEDQVNNTPMKVLTWKTPNQVFTHALESASV